MSDLDRSHPATPQRRARARAEGHVPRSHDLSAAVVLMAGAALLLWCGHNVAQSLGALARQQWSSGAWLAADRDLLIERLTSLAGEVGQAVLPLLGLMLATAIAVELAQTGFLFRVERVAPDFNRINPLSHLGRIFSATTLGRVASGLAKVAVIALVGWWALQSEVSAIQAAGSLSPAQLGLWLGDLLPWTLAKIAGGLVLLGGIDYALAWWRHERSLAMTSQELRAEMREMGGSRKAVERRKPLMTERTTEAVSSIGPS